MKTKKDHSVVFEIASKYCISGSFVDYDGYSISSKGFLPTVVDLMVISFKFTHSAVPSLFILASSVCKSIQCLISTLTQGGKVSLTASVVSPSICNEVMGSDATISMFFLEFFCFFYDPVDVGNLMSASSAFILNIWKFLVRILLTMACVSSSLWSSVQCILQSLSVPMKTLEQQVNQSQQGPLSMVLLSQVKVALEPAPAPHPILHLQPQQLLKFQQWHLLQQPYSPPPLYPFQPPQAHLYQFPQQPQLPLQQQLAHLQQQMQLTLTVQPPGQTAQALKTLPPRRRLSPRCLDMTQQWRVIPEEGFFLGCVFAIMDYPEQVSEKQLLATWKRIIQTHGGAVDPTFSSRCTHLLCESQVSGLFTQVIKERKRCIMAHWLNMVLKKKLVPPPLGTALSTGLPAGGQIISVTGFVDSDRDDLKRMVYLAGAKYTGYLCRSNTVLICREPTGLKYEKAKEWQILCANVKWLGDILVPLKVSAELLMGVRLPPKPKQNEVTNIQPSSKSARIEDIPPPSKKLPPELTPFVLFTEFESVEVQEYIKKLHILGGEVAESAQKCTHLIASKVKRTVKFLMAVSVVKHIVIPEWLEECFKCQKFIEAEVLSSFSLEESLRRAHVSPLFKAKYLYITPGICPSLSTMKAIVECAGGKVLSKKPSIRKLMEHKQDKSLSEIILIACENDLHLCQEYFARGIDVHNAEFVLTGVLTQTLDYES
ncbi:hypothetical protein FD754_021140, partial [Muntiacus muntjak]